MIQQWIESVVLKRMALALAAAVASAWVAHSVPITEHLAAAGISLTVKIDPSKLADYLTMILFATSQGAHEWIAAKYPEVGKYI